MDIQCDKCKTIYNIDDSSAQGQDISARCVRCGHLFAIDDKARNVVSPFEIFDTAPQGKPVHPVPKPTPKDTENTAATTAAADGIETTTQSLPQAEKLSLTTSSSHEDGQDEQQPSAQDAVTIPAPEDFSFSGDDTGDATAEAAEEPAAPQPAQESAIPGPTEDFSFSATTDAVPPEIEAKDDQQSAPEWSSDSAAFSFSSLPDNRDETPKEESAFESTGEFTFNSLSNQDDDTENRAADTSALAPEQLTSEALAPQPLPEKPRTAEHVAPEQPQQDSGAPQRPLSPVKEKRKTSKLLIFLLLIIILLAGVYGYLYTTLGTTDIGVMIDSISRQINPPPAQQQGQIRIISTHSYYVDNATLGQLLIIEGEAANDYPNPRAEILVSANLFNNRGKKIGHRNAYCGNILSRAKLKTISEAELKRTMNNSFGDALSNANVEAGQKIPFMLIFAHVPADLSEFSVEPAASKPVTR